MQTTAAALTGHTDLLSGILKVQVRNEDKITEQGRIYCQNQQDELYKTLDQIDGWYNLFKKEAEKYEGKIKLKHESNGKITTSSYDLHYRYNNDEKDYTHHEFTPFRNINELVDSHQGAVKSFINRIIGNPPFNLKFDFRLSQEYYIDKACQLLNPTGFLMIIVPASFMQNEFWGGRVGRVNEDFSFIGQTRLAPHAFTSVGVDNFNTKIMDFLRRSQHKEKVGCP